MAFKDYPTADKSPGWLFKYQLWQADDGSFYHTDVGALGWLKAVMNANAPAVVTEGTSSDDHLYGFLMDDRISAGAGNDYVDGRTGDDWVDGGDGNDTILGGDGHDVLYGGAGDDVLDGGAANDELHGGIGNDLLLGGDGDDALYGEAGNDVLKGGAGNDWIDGGDGTDTADYSDATGPVTIDLVAGTADGDASVGSDTLVGIERAVGSAYGDTLIGGPGHVLAGGLGDDTYVVDTAGVTIVENAGAGIDTVRTSLGSFSLETAANVENLVYTGTGSFAGTGNALDNIINGGAGNDVLHGGAGNDTLYGGAGDDSLYADSGHDVLYGGAGTDKLFAGNDGSYLDAGDGRDYVYAGAGADTFVGGSDWNCVLYVNATSGITLDTSTGKGTGWAAGDTFIDIQQYRGSEFDDYLYASGNETRHLKGGAGNDTLAGGGGDDVLRGDAGHDILSGGAGHDMIYFKSLGDAGDVMKDWQSGPDGDYIDFGYVAKGFDAATSNVDNFVRAVDNGHGGTDIMLDAAGAGSNWTTMVTLEGVTGVNVDQMYADHQIIFKGDYYYL